MENKLPDSIRSNKDKATYWSELWKSGHTDWGMGMASPPIVNYLSQYGNKEAAILIPGCGNAYEAEYLSNRGFKEVTLLDIATEAVCRLKNNFGKRQGIRILCEDFFGHQGKYDLIIEQAFFCAQQPEKRREYVQKMYDLLKPGGNLAGLLFNREFEREGPPFGGNRKAYESLFAPYFELSILEQCRNSIPPRAGAELFFVFRKGKVAREPDRSQK